MDRVLSVQGFVDFGWDGDINSWSSTSKNVFVLFGGAVTWLSKKQQIVSLSTTEAKYMATTHACKVAMWLLKRLSNNTGFKS